MGAVGEGHLGNRPLLALTDHVILGTKKENRDQIITSTLDRTKSNHLSSCI